MLIPCSRSAHDQNVLARRAQWDQHGCHPGRAKQASLEGSIRSMLLVRCAQSRAAWPLLLKRGSGK